MITNKNIRDMTSFVIPVNVYYYYTRAVKTLNILRRIKKIL
jgi:hypothetical protein